MAKQPSHLANPTVDPFVANANFQRQTEFARNSAYGGAAVCLAILLALLPLGVTTGALAWSVLGAAIGVPAFVGIAIVYEMYATLGDDHSGKHFRETASRWWLPIPMFVAGVALLAAVGGITWHYDERVGIAFAISTLAYTIWAVALSAVLGQSLVRR